MTSLVRLLFSTTRSSTWLEDLALFVLRGFTGLSMALAHGLAKFPPPDKFVQSVHALGFPAPTVFAWAAAISEFIGGILLFLGLATRPAALMIVGTMSVAGFLRHAADPYDTKERALLYLAVSIFLVLKGAGRFSIDRFISGGRELTV